MGKRRGIVSPDDAIAALVARRLARRDGAGPLVLGLCGAQGSGKSTIAARLARRFPRSAVLSLDDLYRTHADRQELGRRVHPLLATRGVPGTHDVALGIATIGALRAGKPVPLPRFDKACDDRMPAEEWPCAPADCELLIFEGWCVGAVPQDPAELVAPVNRLEAKEDADGLWRAHVHAALTRDYPALFASIDILALLVPPDWPTVLRWRTEQEAGLAGRGMDAAQLARFVQHYERLTRHVWRTMPAYADLTLYLDAQRQPTAIHPIEPPHRAAGDGQDQFIR